MTDGEATTPKELLDVPGRLNRSHDSLRESEAAAKSALVLLDDLAGRLEVHDLGNTSILDVGCGIKFSAAFINESVPVGSYTGIDVYAPVIEHLVNNVSDDRFEYHHLDLYNQRYNPDGQPITAETRLALGDRTFDAIVGYSLFTHLDDRDFELMLQIWRRHAHETTRAVFTMYIDELTPGGHGFVDNWTRAFGDSFPGSTDGYRDVFEDDPLRVTLYSRDYAVEMMQQAGWAVLDISEPIPERQHIVTLLPED